jgi:flavin reductase (DIM6/NTAB) family NADH-FMN oxidoreductase RutF
VDTSFVPEEFELALDGAVSATEALPPAVGLEGDPALAFRRTLGMFATGVTVLTTRVGEQVHGMTVNAFMSVSLRPPLVLASIDRRARMCRMLDEGTLFGVSVLEAGQATLSDYFARRAEKWIQEPRFELVQSTPLVEGALAHLVARIVRSYWGGDHVLFLGQVEHARYDEGEPLIFHGGRYERLMRAGRVSSTLPLELLEPILALGRERAYAEGDEILRRGSPAGELLLVLEGTVRVDRPGRRSLTLGPGELLGELGAFGPDGRRTADVHAEGPVRCVAVTRDVLLGALESDPRAAIALVEVLASRFRETA